MTKSNNKFEIWRFRNSDDDFFNLVKMPRRVSHFISWTTSLHEYPKRRRLVLWFVKDRESQRRRAKRGVRVGEWMKEQENVYMNEDIEMEQRAWN